MNERRREGTRDGKISAGTGEVDRSAKSRTLRIFGIRNEVQGEVERKGWLLVWSRVRGLGEGARLNFGLTLGRTVLDVGERGENEQLNILHGRG